MSTKIGAAGRFARPVVVRVDLRSSLRSPCPVSITHMRKSRVGPQEIPAAEALEDPTREREHRFRIAAEDPDIATVVVGHSGELSPPRLEWHASDSEELV